MKKVFISVPMNGRTDEAIKKSIEHVSKIVSEIIEDDVEVIDSFLEGADYTNNPVKCLGESIKRLADADYFVNVDIYWEYKGCEIERHVACSYGIPMITLDARAMSSFKDVIEYLDNRGYYSRNMPSVEVTY